MTDKLYDQQILVSWHKNVRPWVKAVRNGEIASRVEVTNAAIINAIVSRKPATVLDVGCGEGWLVHELLRQGITAYGIDAIPAFIDVAEHHHEGRFRVMTYEELSVESFTNKFDVVVCNFSLLGKESVEHIFKQVAPLLSARGAFIIQTLHPVTVCGEQYYEDGWRTGSWSGFSEAFTEPAPWYFRTKESWELLYAENGLRLISTIEPVYPKTTSPASMIFVGESAGNA